MEDPAGMIAVHPLSCGHVQTSRIPPPIWPPRPMMRWLLRLFLAALVLAPLGASLAVWLAVQAQPLVVNAVAVTPEHVARAKRLLDRHDPRRMRPGVLRTIMLSQEELELSTNYLASRVGNGVARVVLQDGLAAVRATFVLPANPLGRYLNVDALLQDGGRLPTVESLRIGTLRVPAWLCNWLLRAGMARLEGSAHYGAAADIVKRVSITPGLLQVNFEWSAEAASQIRSALVPPQEQARWQAYQERLAAVIAASAQNRALGLDRLLGPLLQLAQQRSAGGDPALEHRAMLVVLAFYVNGKGLAALVPSARDWAVPERRVVTLSGRTDFPQHFLISAALAATAGSPLADAVGLYKEVDDARRGSGFSFNDIAADRAGTRFGELAVSGGTGLARLQQLVVRGLREADLIPEVRDLPEFMAEPEFLRRYGGIGAPPYRRMMADIEQRIAGLPLYRRE